MRVQTCVIALLCTAVCRCLRLLLLSWRGQGGDRDWRRPRRGSGACVGLVGRWEGGEWGLVGERSAASSDPSLETTGVRPLVAVVTQRRGGDRDDCSVRRRSQSCIGGHHSNKRRWSLFELRGGGNWRRCHCRILSRFRDVETVAHGGGAGHLGHRAGSGAHVGARSQRSRGGRWRLPWHGGSSQGDSSCFLLGGPGGGRTGSLKGQGCRWGESGGGGEGGGTLRGDLSGCMRGWLRDTRVTCKRQRREICIWVQSPKFFRTSPKSDPGPQSCSDRLFYCFSGFRTLPVSVIRLWTDWAFRSPEFRWKAAARAAGPMFLLDSTVVWTFFFSGEGLYICLFKVSPSIWLWSWSVPCWICLTTWGDFVWSWIGLICEWIWSWCHDTLLSWIWFCSIRGRTSETRGRGLTSTPPPPLVQDGRGNMVRLDEKQEQELEENLKESWSTLLLSQFIKILQLLIRILDLLRFWSSNLMFYLPAEFWDKNRDEMLRLSLELCDALLGLPVKTHVITYWHRTVPVPTLHGRWASVHGSAVVVLRLGYLCLTSLFYGGCESRSAFQCHVKHGTGLNSVTYSGSTRDDSRKWPGSLNGRNMTKLFPVFPACKQ